MALDGRHGRHRGPGKLPKKLTDYLSWITIWHKATAVGEIGQGASPAQNPPPLDAHSDAVLDWYGENVTAFTRDLGLVPGLVQGLGLRGDEKAITLGKLNDIYEWRERMMRRNARAEAEE